MEIPRINAIGIGRMAIPQISPIKNINGILTILNGNGAIEKNIIEAHSSPIAIPNIIERKIDAPKVAPKEVSEARFNPSAINAITNGPTFFVIKYIIKPVIITANQLSLKNNKNSKNAL